MRDQRDIALRWRRLALIVEQPETQDIVPPMIVLDLRLDVIEVSLPMGTGPILDELSDLRNEGLIVQKSFAVKLRL